MNLSKLHKILKSEPAYRLNQAKKAIFQDLLTDWQQATNLPKDLREKLNNEFPLEMEAKVLLSKDKKTVKALLTLSDGKKIEAVLMRHAGRNTVCLSSQVGCPLACLFCATGRLGFSRNLDFGEIINQVLFFNRYLKPKNQRVTNLVFMGMGEPFLNYDNVLKAIDFFNSKEGFNIGARHISISTIGLPDGIRKLAKEELQLNLAISLHAPNDHLRDQIIPMNKQYPLKKVLSALKDYLAKTNRQVMIEYIMIDGFNDTIKEAEQLVNLLHDLPRSLYLINLIAYNLGDFPKQNFKPSSKENIAKFKHYLATHKIKVTERYRLGREIEAACGQLAAKNK